MNKYVLLGVLMFFLYIMSMVAASIEGFTATDLSYPDAAISPSIGGVFSALGAFFNMLLFRIDGVPIFFNLIFIAITFMILYMIIDVVKDIIPFT